LGYAPHSWEALKSHFNSKGYTDKELFEAGLAAERDSGGFYDKFRHRIMFPIRDERGRMAGFGARVLNPEDVPKFMNSPQTPVFDKGHLLYGLDRARRDIRTLDQVVIVEGYLDVIALHQAGYANTVSPMGTALTDHQLYLIKRFTRRMVLALDPDAAGAKATMRGLEIARQTMDRTDEVVFDARGLLGHERRLQADIRVTTLPEGKDPDDVVNADPQEWDRILQAAKPVVIHVMETLASGQDLEDPKIKSQIARQVIPLIEDVPDAIERETYRQRLARLLRVDERALVSGYAPRRGRPERPRRSEPAGSAPSRQAPGLQPAGAALTTITLESRTLGVLMRRPDLLHRVDRVMQEFSLPRISISDFQRSENQVLFQLVLESLEQDLAEPLSFVLNGLDLPMMEWADVVLARTEKLDPVEDRVLEGLLRDILLLRKIYLSDSIDYYRFQLEDTQGKDEKLADELSQRVLQHTQVLQRLDKALARYTSRSAAATH
jgi:DNA primase